MKERNDNEWKDAADKLAEAKLNKEMAEALYKEALDAATLIAPDGAKGFGVELTQVISPGKVAYAKAVKALIPKADLEPFRGDESYWYRVNVSR